MKLQVFLSSAMTGEMLAERTALRTLFAHAQYLNELAELYAIEDHASSRSIQTAFLEEVASSDLVVVLLGTELREAVVKEFDHAVKCGKHILCYIAGSQQPTDELRAFISDRAYQYHAGTFGDASDLVRRIRADLIGEFIRGYRGTAQEIALEDSSQSYLIREMRTPYASSTYFAPADVHELLAKPEYGQLSVDQLIALAMLHLEESGNYLGALLMLEAAILRAPENWMALSNRGLVLQQMGLIYHSQASFEAAAARNPDDATIQYNLGTCHYTNHEYERALIHFEKALEIEPDKASAVSRMAATYIQLGNAEAAVQWATRSLHLDSSEISTANMATALGMAGRRDEAFGYAEQLKGDPARAHELKAFIENRNGNHEACIAEVDAHAKLAPISIRSASLKFESLLALDRRQEADSYFGDIESNHLLTPSEYNNYGHQHMTAFGPTDVAARLFRESVTRDPSCMPCWHNLQSCLGEMGDSDAAIMACDEALELNPLDQKSIQNKAVCLLQLGRVSEIATLMASKVGGLLGPISGNTPEEFVQEMLSSPMGRQLGAVNELAQHLLDLKKKAEGQGGSGEQADSDR